ncbi:MAG: hypothetical protein R2765_06510 [Ferruginibacter sp.]
MSQIRSDSGCHLYRRQLLAPNNSVIWVSDGTQAGTIPLEQFNPTATAGAALFINCGPNEWLWEHIRLLLTTTNGS